MTPDPDHDYTAEQQAFDHGLLDLFPAFTSSGGDEVMGYYDGNTVTALWNYAQFFAVSDNSYSTTFGLSTPGVSNLVSGQTNGVINTLNGTGDEVDGGMGSLTVIDDPDPIGDVCSKNGERRLIRSRVAGGRLPAIPDLDLGPQTADRGLQASGLRLQASDLDRRLRTSDCRPQTCFDPMSNSCNLRPATCSFVAASPIPAV